MCEQCLTNIWNFGEVLPELWVVRARRDGEIMEAGDWGLVLCNDPSIVWEKTPLVDPTYGMSKDEKNMYWNNNPEDDPYNFFPDRMFFDVDMDDTITIFQKATENGYNQEQHGKLSLWLWQKVAHHIKNNDVESSMYIFEKRDKTNNTCYNMNPKKLEVVFDD